MLLAKMGKVHGFLLKFIGFFALFTASECCTTGLLATMQNCAVLLSVLPCTKADLHRSCPIQSLVAVAFIFKKATTTHCLRKSMYTTAWA